MREVAVHYETSEAAEYVVETLKCYVWVGHTDLDLVKENETHSELQEDGFGER
jgi:hypothetical protein